MRAFAAAVCAGCLALSVATAGARPRKDPARGPQSWEVTIAVRLAPESSRPVRARIAVPPDSPRQRLGDLHVTARGLTPEIHLDDPHPHVLLSGKLKGSRRVAVSYRLTLESQAVEVPSVTPVVDPTPDLLPFLSPAPLFQSRSILVRDFLETQVAPLVAGPEVGVMRPILEVTRRELKWRGNGRSLALDVIRRREGKRIGIERAFTTFLRCAGVPARFVEGFRLTSSTRRKREFWTEVWAAGQWFPVSASDDRVGRLPASYVAVARDGTRVVSADGAQASYSVQARRLEELK